MTSLAELFEDQLKDIALTWSWYLLSRNPDTERLLVEEWDRVLKGRAARASERPFPLPLR